MKQAITLSILLAALVTLVAYAGSTAKFSDPDRMAAWLDGHPSEAVVILEGVLSQEQVDAFERAAFPEPDADTKAAALTNARRFLLDAGLSADDATVQAVDAKLDVVQAEASSTR